jgi:hypothetical protein
LILEIFPVTDVHFASEAEITPHLFHVHGKKTYFLYLRVEHGLKPFCLFNGGLSTTEHYFSLPGPICVFTFVFLAVQAVSAL